MRVGAAAHLGGDGEAGVGALLEESADELLAAPVPVHVAVRGHAGVDRRVKGRERVILAHRAPAAAELPAPQPDDSDLTTCTTELP